MTRYFYVSYIAHKGGRLMIGGFYATVGDCIRPDEWKQNAKAQFKKENNMDADSVTIISFSAITKEDFEYAEKIEENTNELCKDNQSSS